MRFTMLSLLAAMTLAGCDPDEGSDMELLDAGDTDPDNGSEGSGDEPAPPVMPNPQPTDLEGDVILRNRVALDMPVLLRPLAEDVVLDCTAVEQDPAAHLPRSSFAPGEEVTLSPHQMVAVWPHEPGERPCYAVWVQTEGLGSRILFWPDGKPPILPYAQSCCDVGEGVVELIPVDDGWSLDLLGNTWLVFPTAD